MCFYLDHGSPCFMFSSYILCLYQLLFSSFSLTYLFSLYNLIKLNKVSDRGSTHTTQSNCCINMPMLLFQFHFLFSKTVLEEFSLSSQFIENIGMPFIATNRKVLFLNFSLCIWCSNGTRIYASCSLYYMSFLYNVCVWKWSNQHSFYLCGKMVFGIIFLSLRKCASLPRFF